MGSGHGDDAHFGLALGNRDPLPSLQRLGPGEALALEVGDGVPGGDYGRGLIQTPLGDAVEVISVHVREKNEV